MTPIPLHFFANPRSTLRMSVPAVEEPSQAPKVSKRFRASDSDITIQSSDGVLFKVHRQNLVSHSEIFAGADAVSGGGSADNEVVPLSETSTTLELLLQCIYNVPQPDLEKVKFSTFAGVAEAAEKYQMQLVIPICKILMKLAIPVHPIAVLGYATRHGHRDLMDLAALGTLTENMDDVVAALQPGSALAWFRYYNACQNATHAVFRDPCWSNLGHANATHVNVHIRETMSKRTMCEDKAKISVMVLKRLGMGPHALLKLEQVVDIAGISCGRCRVDMGRYRNIMEENLKEVSKYSYFFYGSFTSEPKSDKVLEYLKEVL